MPQEALQELLEAGQGGVWHLDKPVPAAKLQAVAKKAGYAFFHVDGSNVSRKEQLLKHMAVALRFPDEFGHNWDALEECLTDLEWIEGSGYLIYYDHIDKLLEAHPDQFETFVEIVRDAVSSWKEDGEAMVVLLAGGKAPKGVPKLKGREA